MDNGRNDLKTLADVLKLVEGADLMPYQRRDMRSAITTVAAMAGVAPAMAPANAPALRVLLKGVRLAAHGITAKTWATRLSCFRAALRLAGAIDSRREGLALKNPAWAPLVEAIADHKRLSCGTAAFLNYCAGEGITPHQVNNAVLPQFHVWLEERTLCPKPKDVVRRG